ncbi:hypothetical protein HDU83_001181 [Entophlyctis luteolus]|nr:hypothetical protein HDU82_003444 [Entophlyctis luteolus]KAJ3356390.1 hypothetical protein HDU83_001181 [Entophlyctis luteolus]KAJ3394989.1 hypothetical protein HDU84_004447 [Entophlyctis sp. JEL0112]
MFARNVAEQLLQQQSQQHEQSTKEKALGVGGFVSRFRQQSALSASNVPPPAPASSLEPPKLTSSASSASLPAPHILQRPSSEGSSKVPSPEELEMFEAMVRDRMSTHAYLPSLTQSDIRRFLIANRNSPVNALKQLQTTLDWRAAINFNAILSEDFSDLEATRKLTIDSTDLQQNAVMVWQQHRHHPVSPSTATSTASPSLAATPRTTVSTRGEAKDLTAASAPETAAAAAVARNVRFFVYTIERAKQAHRVRPDNKITVIVDRTHMSPANYDQPLGKAILAILPHYPDLFDSYYVFPRNALLMVAWKLTRVFLDPLTVAKIRLLAESEVPKVLGEILSKQELLVRYGGEKDDQAGSSLANSALSSDLKDSMGSGTPKLEDEGDDDDDFIDANDGRQSFDLANVGEKKIPCVP